MPDTPMPLSPSELTMSHAKRKLSQVPAFQFAPADPQATSTLIGTLGTCDARVEIHTDHFMTLASPAVAITYADIESIQGPASKDRSADAALTFHSRGAGTLTLAFPWRDQLNDAFVMLTFFQSAVRAWRRQSDTQTGTIPD